MRSKVVTAQEAAAKVPDGALIGLSGVGPYGVALEVYDAVEERFEKERHPAGISLIHSGGNMFTDKFAKDGMIKAYYSGLPNLDKDLMASNKFPIYSLSQGLVV